MEAIKTRERQSKWFENVFLPSFDKGKETRISEKQFNIFVKNSDNNYEIGYTEYFEGRNFRAYSWSCISGTRYYVTVK